MEHYHSIIDQVMLERGQANSCHWHQIVGCCLIVGFDGHFASSGAAQLVQLDHRVEAPAQRAQCVQ